MPYVDVNTMTAYAVSFGRVVEHWAKRARPGWRCFHCDEVFTDREAARLHFGDNETRDPACCISIEHVRWLEEQHRLHCNEDSGALRAISALAGQHETLRRRAEEEGYAKGLADAKEHPTELGLRPIEEPASVSG